jgi:beta-phosphoglucomutase-like phosphatase (HAD superfamily)
MRWWECKQQKAAGMRCPGCHDHQPGREMQQADLIVARLNQLTISALQSILA